jgi:hypothetical protein
MMISCVAYVRLLVCGIVAGSALGWLNTGSVLAQPAGAAGKASANKGGKNVKDVADVEVTYWAPRKLVMKFGIDFNSGDNYCTRFHATIPFPTDWPEQKVTVTSRDISPGAVTSDRTILPGAYQMIVDAPQIAPQSDLKAIITVEIEKSFIKAPIDPSSLTIPKRNTKDLQWFMGTSPYINPEYPEIKRIAREIKAREPENAWSHVELLYDWVRDNIAYKTGPIKQTNEAMKDRSGDCEELTSIFIALCRASDIPARCVWVPEHCYPEFCLLDANGDAHWYPCQIAGDRQFGEINEYRPILQKGDRFIVPEKKDKVRYVSEYLKCNQKQLGPTPPKAKTIRDLGDLQSEIDRLQATHRRAEKLEVDSAP